LFAGWSAKGVLLKFSFPQLSTYKSLNSPQMCVNANNKICIGLLHCFAGKRDGDHTVLVLSGSAGGKFVCLIVSPLVTGLGVTIGDVLSGGVPFDLGKLDSTGLLLSS